VRPAGARRREEQCRARARACRARQAAEAAAARDAAARELEEAQELLYGQVGDLKQQARPNSKPAP
jgi:hypothetical protein